MYHLCSAYNPAVVRLKPRLIQRFQRPWLIKGSWMNSALQSAENRKCKMTKLLRAISPQKEKMIVSDVLLRDGLRFIQSGWVLHSQQSVTGELVPISPASPFRLAHILQISADDFLDLSDHDDASQRALHLLTREGLRRVPHRAVRSDNGLWGHVICIVTPFNALRTSKRKRSQVFCVKTGEWFTLNRIFFLSECHSPFKEVKVVKFNGTTKRTLRILHLLFIHVIGSWSRYGRCQEQEFLLVMVLIHSKI